MFHPGHRRVRRPVTYTFIKKCFSALGAPSAATSPIIYRNQRPSATGPAAAATTTTQYTCACHSTTTLYQPVPPEPASSNSMAGSHHMAIRELDLSDWHTNTISEKLNQAVPALKTSAAFFTFLRANLVLNPSPMSSNTNTPVLEPFTSQTMAPPSPSPLGANPPLVPLDDIPPLSLEVLDDRDDKVEAFRLVADSIAQQRQQASLSLVFHPFCLAVLVAASALAYQYSYNTRQDLGLAIMMLCGVVMSYLMAIRYFTSGYLKVAEDLDWPWLTAEDGEEDIIIGTRFGEEIIGSLVLRLEPSSTTAGKRRSRSSNLRGGKGVIRAWTTKLKYRHKGVGADMLKEAVRVTKEKCGKDAEVGFAKEHANSTMLLSEVFNGAFRKRERSAAKALDNILAEWEAGKKKR